MATLENPYVNEEDLPDVDYSTFNEEVRRHIENHTAIIEFEVELDTPCIQGTYYIQDFHPEGALMILSYYNGHLGCTMNGKVDVDIDIPIDNFKIVGAEVHAVLDN